MELATKRNYKSEQIEKPDISVCIYRTPKIFRYNVYRISTIKMLCVPLFHLHMCIVRSPPPRCPSLPPYSILTKKKEEKHTTSQPNVSRWFFCSCTQNTAKNICGVGRHSAFAESRDKMRFKQKYYF